MGLEQTASMNATSTDMTFVIKLIKAGEIIHIINIHHRLTHMIKKEPMHNDLGQHLAERGKNMIPAAPRNGPRDQTAKRPDAHRVVSGY